jgi:NAD(P)-dependent dehydrogenase (short-subunit alcohol dehydrogenase family)
MRRAPDVLECDVTDPASVQATLQRTCEELGTPSILVNTAGIAGPFATPAADADGDTWDNVLCRNDTWMKVFEVNVVGCLNCCREFARRLIAEGSRGAIVNTTSISGGPVVEPGLAAYSASKASVNMLTRLAATEFGRHGISVNAIGPGLMAVGMAAPDGTAPSRRSTEFVDAVSERTPLGHRLGEASDIAQAVLGILAMDWVTGQIILADGGLTLTSPVPKPSRVVAPG